MFKNKTRKQVGDTIIEVMIAIVVMSGVLGAAFAISNKSSKTTQANHERYQAQMYANQQAEWIKSYAADNRATLTGLTVAPGVTYCMVDATTAPVLSSDNRCVIDSLYHIKFTPKQMPGNIGGPTDDTTNTYTINVSWDSLTSGGTDQVELIYGI